MQDFCKKDSNISSVHSTAPFVTECASWWTSSASQIQPSSVSKNLSLEMATPNHCGQNVKQIGFQFPDQDSSSTQSTGQSYHEVASVGESNPYGQSITSSLSGYSGTHGKPGVGQQKSAVLMGTQDCVLHPSQFNYAQSFACVPLSYTDPYYSGLLAAYGPQAMIAHPQMLGMGPTRVPLPVGLPQDEPIFVNPKQYRAILRRRQYRAKLEAQNKIAKARKPYLHESRHLHALKRARGSSGRFLNTKKLEESNPASTANGQDMSGSTQFHSTTKMSESDVHQRENYKEGASTTSCSGITSASNSENFLHQQEFRFSASYPSCFSRAMQSGGLDVRGGNQHFLSVHR